MVLSLLQRFINSSNELINGAVVGPEQSDCDVSFRIQLDKSILLCLAPVFSVLVEGNPHFTEDDSKIFPVSLC